MSELGNGSRIHFNRFTPYRKQGAFSAIVIILYTSRKSKKILSEYYMSKSFVYLWTFFSSSVVLSC